MNLSLPEIDVLRLLSEGKTIKAVASDLSISERRANKMYQRIYRKLGVHNVVDCLRVAFRRGLLSQDQFLGTDINASRPGCQGVGEQSVPAAVLRGGQTDAVPRLRQSQRSSESGRQPNLKMKVVEAVDIQRKIVLDT